MGLLRGKGRGAEGAGKPLRLYYASDIHGSERLWRKFLNAAKTYSAPVIVMGGDVTGKAIVPLVQCNGGYEMGLFGRREILLDERQLEDAKTRIGANGMYPYCMDAEELARAHAMSTGEREAWFADLMMETFERWLALADERLAGVQTRCFLMPGNDDPPAVQDAIERATRVEGCEDRIVEFGCHEMISLGYSNKTPWDSPRELDEDELYERIDGLACQLQDSSTAIFNLHVPPYDSTLDMAPELDDELRIVMLGSEPNMIPVGSSAVRELIERYQPLLSLHGHVHESAGATKIGRTLCINPGSDYHTGRIAGCLLALRGAEVRHQFLTG